MCLMEQQGVPKTTVARREEHCCNLWNATELGVPQVNPR